MSRLTNPQDSVVTHTLKSVRHHRIDFRLPTPPTFEEEAFVIATNQGHGEIAMRPRDFQQFIACLQKSLNDVTGGHLNA
jgi:hypothetical protein